MAKFKCDFNAKTYAYMSGEKGASETLSLDDLLEVLRPAAMALRDKYKEKLQSLGLVLTGELADSIDFEDDTTGSNFARFIVKPFGRRKKGTRTRKSRAGPSGRKYAKHNRSVAAKAISNEELGYLLEYGTPRIDATHWMQLTNEESGEEIQQIIDDEFTKLLKKKGLI